MIDDGASMWFAGLLRSGHAPAPVPPTLSGLVAGMLESTTLLPQGTAGYALNRAFVPLDEARIRAACVAPLSIALQPICASTQNEARALAASALPAAPAGVVLAEAQTGGRGRAGRRWETTPLASLAFTLVTDTRLPANALPALAPALGVVLAEALAPEAADLGLKWPNDLWRDGGKLAGLLVEAAPRPDGSLRLAIGIGLNVRELPVMQALGRPVRALPQGGRIDRDRLAARLIDALWQGWQSYAAEGFGPFAARYARRDLLRGQSVTLTIGGRQRTGIGAGLAEDGALLLSFDGHIERIVAGEVEGPLQLRPDAGV